ncbi:hypothetical protein [Hyphococcus sp.]|uniref:hypothetical protein n=1 Tax=Hyphococcus sp. TaxID=2038636 RepID=UPI0035C7335A
MMSSIRHMHRVIAVLLIALWGAVGIVAPAHAAEEDIHHATQHDAGEERAATQGEPADEGSIHPEHAAHCHFHALSRASLEPASLLLFASKVRAPENGVVPQASLSSLFRPPRI